jgi:PTS system nitrogen regulatory IIA component
MELNIQEVAKLLNVNDATIVRWIHEHELPARFDGTQYRFNRNEILEWAMASKITLSSDLFKSPEGTVLPTLEEAIAAGGVFYDVGGSDKETALAEIVRRMDVPPLVDRQFLLSVLLAREAAASTGIGDGIAFPHVRNPIVLQVKRPMIALSFLASPIEYGAADGKPVFALFTLLCPTVRIHLHLLSRLAFALRHPRFKGAIERRAPREEILALARETADQLMMQAAQQRSRQETP